MAFSLNQLYFVSIFFGIFFIVLFYAYRSDLKQLGTQSQGALKVLGIIILVLLIFYGTVKFLAI